MQSDEAANAVIAACKHSVPSYMKEKSRQAIVVSNRIFYSKFPVIPVAQYNHPEQKSRETKIGEIQRKCIADFCHSDDSSSIDSNSHKIITVDGEKHVARVWHTKTVNEQYTLFLHSDVLHQYHQMHPHFRTPSRSLFYHNRCKCVSAPVMQSCVDIHTSSLVHYMRAIGKFVRNNDSIKR